MPHAPELPVLEAMPGILDALERHGQLVLVAETGAGKTTRVPAALANSRLTGDGEVLVLEPRRLAARRAAEYVAALWDEAPGGRVGYQVRGDSARNASTRLCFMTEGVLARRLLAEPELPGVSAVVLDEFHERSVDADVALALLRRLRERRPELLLLVMSATLDAESIGDTLGAPIQHVAGRCHPVAIEYLELPPERGASVPLERKILAGTRRLLERDCGDILVFLPGAREIRLAAAALEPLAAERSLAVFGLHGDLPSAQQDRALAPNPRRKIILATNVAETSITIDGVGAVLDSGLERRASDAPWSGLPRLETRPITRASAEQRAGRAGRLGPGTCLRLYGEAELRARPARPTPAIRRSELASLRLLLAGLDINDPTGLAWLDPPEASAWARAETLLAELGALDGSRVTELGRTMLRVPLHPRAARLAIEAARRGAARWGALAAAALGERDPRLEARTRFGERDRESVAPGPSDLLDIVERRLGGAARRDGLDRAAARRIAEEARRIEKVLRREAGSAAADADEALFLATLASFPDRIARRLRPRGRELAMAGGGSARLAEHSVVQEGELLVAVDAEESGGGRTVVRQASRVEAEWLLELFPDLLTEFETTRLLPESERIELRSGLCYRGLVIEESRASHQDPARIGAALAELVSERGLGCIADTTALDALAGRLAFAHRHDPSLPILDDELLAERLRELAAFANSLPALRRLDFVGHVLARFDADERSRLDALAPATLTLASGRRLPLRYEPEPSAASFLQDFFGSEEGPRVAGGRVPVVLHLLAPNRRDVQVTTDLAGFWRTHYPALRRQLSRRYPRHHWPEDPLNCEPAGPGGVRPRPTGYR